MRRLSLFLGVLAAVAWARPAAADDLETCLTLSFAPLEDTLPACDRLIETGDPDRRTLLRALMARAEARSWAQTYHRGHEIDPPAMLAAQRADLDRAVTLAREFDNAQTLRLALRRRAETLIRLDQPRDAVADFTAAMAMGAPEPEELLGRSLAYERQTYVNLAVADMTLLILFRGADPNLPNWLVRRAELHEADHDPEAARTDYRQALALAPGNETARAALARLGK